MKNIFSSILFLLFSLLCFSQNTKLTDEKINNSGASKLSFIDKIEDAINLAQKDIDQQVIFLLMQSGIAPIVNNSDQNFERKYNVHFQDFGCVAPNYKLVVAYNKEVFKYLTKTYGKKWIKECRKDIIGFKEYKRKI